MNTLLLLALGMALVGIFVAIWGARTYRRQGAQHADASARWKQARATVVDARIVERERSDSNDNDYTVYEPRLRYSYAVGGAAHEGERINLCSAESYSDPSKAGQWLAAHAPGMAIDIWYDPGRPGESACVLDKPSLFGAIVTVGVGVGLVGMAIWILFMLPAD
jgi:hypothetical protein